MSATKTYYFEVFLSVILIGRVVIIYRKKIKVNVFPENMTNISKTCPHSQKELWKPFLLLSSIHLNLHSWRFFVRNLYTFSDFFSIPDPLYFCSYTDEYQLKYKDIDSLFFQGNLTVTTYCINPELGRWVSQM